MMSQRDLARLSTPRRPRTDLGCIGITVAVVATVLLNLLVWGGFIYFVVWMLRTLGVIA